jgi:thiol:disulfide interchange protein DsbD
VDGPELQRYQLELTGTVALPTYAVVDPDGRLIHRWQGVASTDEFSGFLDEAAERFEAERAVGDLTASRD